MASSGKNSFLGTIIDEVRRLLDSGYYDVDALLQHEPRELSTRLLNDEGTKIIAEIKLSSPTRGVLRQSSELYDLLRVFNRAGLVGISVLTQPAYFDGSIARLAYTRKLTPLPVIMKDFIVSTKQIEAAHRSGADVVLLIMRLFRRGLASGTLSSFIEYAHRLSLEVLLETHGEEEYLEAHRTDSDIIGINNRNLEDLNIDMEMGSQILYRHGRIDRPVIIESGIDSPEYIARTKKLGASGFLIGSALMNAVDLEAKISELLGG